jgi:uncharacterized YceG family protein
VADANGRTDQEREAARIERERLRTQRQADAPADGDAPAEPVAAQPGQPLLSDREPPVVQLVPDVSDEDLDDDDDVDYEHPSGTRRMSRLHRTRRPRDGAAPRAKPAPQRPARQRERTHSLAGRVAALLALIVAAVAIWFLVELFQPFHGSGHGSVVVTIPPHSSSSAVGDLLARDGVISSGFFFELRAILAGDRGKLRSGTFRLERDMSYSTALKALTTAPPAVPVTDVTIIPGRTRAQVDTLLRAEGVNASYLAATRSSPVLNPRAYGAPRGTPSLEGFLFPDTYQLRAPLNVHALVAAQLRRFAQQFATVNLGFARSRHLTPYQLLIVASMVEAEAEVAGDRPLIASVIYNRLALGMPLQIDATTRYATGNYSRPLTVSELDSPSPYNTRNRPGLTPTPIDSPALTSIQAAAHPARTDYLYFVVKPCGHGQHVFASTYAQFLRDEAQYYSARARNGGNSPVHC